MLKMLNLYWTSAELLMPYVLGGEVQPSWSWNQPLGVQELPGKEWNFRRDVFAFLGAAE